MSIEAFRSLEILRICGVGFLLISVSPLSAEAKKCEIRYKVSGGEARFKYDCSRCDAIGWEKHTKISVVTKILTKFDVDFGLEQTHTRNLDVLQKDFGLKFKLWCESCLIQAMIQSLSPAKEEQCGCEQLKLQHDLSLLRQLHELVKIVKEEKDAVAKSDGVKSLLAKFDQFAEKGFTRGCERDVKLSVSNDKLVFVDKQTVQTIQDIRNMGRHVLTWSMQNIPPGFIIQPAGGRLDPGNGHPVNVHRDPGVPVEAATRYEMKLAYDDRHHPIHVSVPKEGAALLMDLSRELLAVRKQPLVQDALNLVNSSLTDVTSDAWRYFYAGQILTYSGAIEEAEKAYKEVISTDPAFAQHPSFLMALGSFEARRSNPDEALRLFGEARAKSLAYDRTWSVVPNLYSGTLLASIGSCEQPTNISAEECKRAGEYFREPYVREEIKEKTWLRGFLEAFFEIKNLRSLMYRLAPE